MSFSLFSNKKEDLKRRIIDDLVRHTATGKRELEAYLTDTIPLRQDQNLSKFTVLSVADIFADVIERVHNYKEISSIFFK